MTNFIKYAKYFVAVIGAMLGKFLGGLDGVIYALAAFMLADYATGVMLAVMQKKLSSSIGFKGICKKMLILIFVGLANVLDVYILKNGSVLRTAVVFFYISNEGISITENAVKLGLPVPEKIKTVLKQIGEKK